ncbi:hypothetical protein [Candidatus Enterococcus mansonii]|uniref:Uncharacterized protein n=1 Tax=Candidatus Enterococcus mansonii TaxID=1834181 RepID=A0A242CCX1_9ENTE|nr:hypothetical protein [Enterococcus sp. 4G2_DIV0659]OTO08093.1 hypothetical protein A5880_002363 [Enterococcus sp. 4G2_DIV0659]
MTTDERMLEVLQQTLAKIEELNTRLSHIEHDLTSDEHYRMNIAHYAEEIELSLENNNIMG